MLGWELPPHNSGGLGVACYHMSKALALQGASIDFVVPYQAHHDDIDFMRVHSATQLPPLHRFGWGAYDGYSEDGQIIQQVPTSLREIQQQYATFVQRFVETHDQPAAIHAHDWLTMEAGVLAKQLTGSPLVVHVHATEFDRSGNNYGNPLIHEIEEQALLVADRIIAVSNITKNIIVHRYNIPADKIEVVHNALDPGSLGSHTYDAITYRYLEHLKGEGYTVVGVVTRFTIQKGLVNFLRAAAKASSVYDKLVFLLAGDGEQRDELLRLSAELGIADKVFFTGFVRGQKWRDAYSVIDIFVMSSVSEPFGLTALEAAHHDTALVISKQSGVGEVLSNVFRYDFWDTTTLADELVGMATSHALLRSLKDNVKHEYAQISWRDVAAKCIHLYKNLGAGVRV